MTPSAASPAESPAASRDNGFGALRLGFSVLVLVAHAPELIDGDRHREILTRLFGSLSFGDFAVDGFFVISGALITASWLGAASWHDYLWRRVVRIYPGFLVAFAVSLLVVAPLGGGRWPLPAEIGPAILAALRLQGPGDAGGAFAGQPYADLNGATWSIPYEFTCYLMILGLGSLGLFRRRWLILGLMLLAWGLSARHVLPSPAWGAPPAGVLSPAAPPPGLPAPPPVWRDILGQVAFSWRLVGLFLAGSLYHLCRDAIPWRRDLALLAAAALVAALFLPVPLAEIGFAGFGGYVIFYLARAARGTFWARINAKNDISYGLYLYGWPMQKLVWWYAPDAPLPLAFLAALALATGCGWISWLGVERPALRWARARPPQ